MREAGANETFFCRSNSFSCNFLGGGGVGGAGARWELAKIIGWRSNFRVGDPSGNSGNLWFRLHVIVRR